MENFSDVVEMAIARSDAWHGLWLLFLIVSIGVIGWAFSNHLSFRSRAALVVTFVVFCGTQGVWLNSTWSQRVALYEYAGAMVDTASALPPLPYEGYVEQSLQLVRQAGVVDAIEPAGHIIWLTCYAVLSGLVLLLLWISFKGSAPVPGQHDH